jgi:hypothetical protein
LFNVAFAIRHLFSKGGEKQIELETFVYDFRYFFDGHQVILLNRPNPFIHLDAKRLKIGRVERNICYVFKFDGRFDVRFCKDRKDIWRALF